MRRESTVIELDLLDNAYDFLNESLLYAYDAFKSGNLIKCKFAIINLVQCLELSLKEKLKRIHPILIYDNIDKIPKDTKNIKTVSLYNALQRIINSTSLDMTEDEVKEINIAIILRNQMIHYEFSFAENEARIYYSKLFQFVIDFHLKHLNSDINDRIEKTMLEFKEELLIFAENCILYYDQVITREYLNEINECQKIKQITIDGKKFNRIKYGNEPYLLDSMYEKADRESRKNDTCGDCSVAFGQYHTVGCDMEICPKCGMQLISCACSVAEMLEKD